MVNAPDSTPPHPARRTAALACTLMAPWIAGCAGGPDADDASAPAAAWTPPATKTIDVSDDYHGTTISDPYRWLEDQDGDDVRRWVQTQNQATRAFLDAAPGRDALEQRLTELWNYGRRSAPLEAGDRWLWFRNDGLQNQDVVVLADSPDEAGQVILDPNTLSEDGTAALAGMLASKDGRYLAYAISERGSDWKTYRVLDLASGETLPDRVEWSKFAGVAWSPDNAGFFYQRYPAPKDGETFEATNQQPSLCYHRVGTDAAQDTVIYQQPQHPNWGFAPYVTEDGHYLIISIWEGTDQRNRVAYVDLTLETTMVVPLLMDFDAEWDFLGNDGETFYFRTNRDAPLGRVVALDVGRFPNQRTIDLHRESPEAPPPLDTIIDQGDHALQAATMVGHHIALTYLVDASHRIMLHDLGNPEADPTDLALPALGSVAGIAGRAGRDDFYVTFASFTYPSSILRGDVGGNALEEFFTPDLPLDPASYEVEQVFLRGNDGTRLPMFLVHKPGIVLDGSHPTYLYGYGGFNISMTPRFSASTLAWVDQGGIYAHAVLRGGGEYGDAWHEAGMLDRKQNVFDDFVACARYLLRNGHTSPRRLAIGGRSNGGLLAGACLVQHPELFGAAIPEVGVLDMLRYHKFTIGWAWVPEYGSAEDPAQFDFLRAYSPLHNVEPGGKYPPTLVMTGDHDDRVLPGHSYKFAATLQQAQAAPDPILIRIDTSAGHGAGKPTAMRIREAVDRWAFLNATLGMPTGE